MTRFFVDASGAFLGAFGPRVPAPAGGIAVPTPPSWGGDTWNAQTGAWTGTPNPALTLEASARNKRAAVLATLGLSSVAELQALIEVGDS